MASKKGQYAVCKEWAKHLRKKFKKLFWSVERSKAKNALKQL